MRNSQSESMDIFIDDYENEIKKHFGITDAHSYESIHGEEAQSVGVQMRQGKINKKIFMMLKNDEARRKLRSESHEDRVKYLEGVKEMLNERYSDLNSMDFESDKDCSYKY